MGETPQVYRNEGCANWELEPQTRTDGPFERLVHCLHQDLEAIILPTTPTIAGIQQYSVVEKGSHPQNPDSQLPGPQPLGRLTTSFA